MEVGLYIRDYMEDPDRPMHQQVEEAAEVCRRAKSLGFSVIYAPQHYISHPTVWMQPMQTLARLAPDAEGLKLLTGVMLLPYHNPVDIAEQTVTLDHISNGRFILGVGIGYREAELSAFGTNRRDRVSRFEESLALMKLLWSGEEVDFDGRHWQVQGARLGLTPVQKPHPPVWMAAQSRGAVRRAAALADRVILGPQPSWEDIGLLTRQYKEALEELGRDPDGRIGVHRSIAIARDRETAITGAQGNGGQEGRHVRRFQHAGTHHGGFRHRRPAGTARLGRRRQPTGLRRNPEPLQGRGGPGLRRAGQPEPARRVLRPAGVSAAHL